MDRIRLAAITGLADGYAARTRKPPLSLADTVTAIRAEAAGDRNLLDVAASEFLISALPWAVLAYAVLLDAGADAERAGRLAAARAADADRFYYPPRPGGAA